MSKFNEVIKELIRNPFSGIWRCMTILALLLAINLFLLTALKDFPWIALSLNLSFLGYAIYFIRTRDQ